MKNFKWLMIVMVSMCFLIGLVSMGWSVEMQMKPGVKEIIQVVPHCPAGYTLAPDGSKCTRNKPATPCASGFHVEWGTCITGSGLGAQDPYPCGYKCIPDMPAAGSYFMICPAKHYPASEGLNVGACSVSCRDIVY